MEIDYKKITDFVLDSGKRLVMRAGKIKDIGITKTDVTEEDFAIERGFKEMISTFGSDHVLYAEEENNVFQKTKHLWVVDPISGTSTFLKGKPHYSIVVSHLIDQETVFAAVYDPSVDELFVAHKGRGATLNGKKIEINLNSKTYLLRVSSIYNKTDLMERMKELLTGYEIDTNTHSMAVNYCSVARGDYGGIISFTKDTFPEFAGSLIVREAGGMFTNLSDESNILPTDKIFIGGGKEIHGKLIDLVKENFNKLNL